MPTISQRELSGVIEILKSIPTGSNPGIISASVGMFDKPLIHMTEVAFLNLFTTFEIIPHDLQYNKFQVILSNGIVFCLVKVED